MGTAKNPDLVKYFCVALSADSALLNQIASHLYMRLGQIELSTDPTTWNYSPAYRRELGRGIRRRVFAFTDLHTPESLSEWKVTTNELERSLSMPESHKRRINLDPGYLSATQVVLASTKKDPNRVYVDKGIYADLTLYYEGDSFRAFSRMTLPEYRTRSSVIMFNRLRESYIRQLQSLTRGELGS